MKDNFENDTKNNLALTEERLASIEFSLSWETDHGKHTDSLFAPRVNLWRDILPPDVKNTILGRQKGEIICSDYPPSALYPRYREENVFRLKTDQLLSPGKMESR